MNVQNLNLWTAALRSQKYQQTDGILTKHNEEGAVVGHCCLGVGCEVAGIEKATRTHVEDSDDDGERYDAETHTYYGSTNSEELPPSEFYDWLGVNLGPDEDLPLDWPPEYERLTTQAAGERKKLLQPDMTCANLNDACHLSFHEIADMLDYFGVRGK